MSRMLLTRPVSLLYMVVVADAQEAYIVALAVGGTAEPCLGANTPEYPFCAPGDPDPPRKMPCPSTRLTVLLLKKKRTILV